MSYSHDDLRYLFGDRVLKGSVPAVWWISVHPDICDGYDQWKRDYGAHIDKARVLADSIGVDLIETGRTFVNFFEPITTLSGFETPKQMLLWEGHPDYRPVPAGWRHDKRAGILVPLRKTIADRNSEVNKQFNAIRKIPDVRAYLRGLPINFRFPTGRDGSISINTVGYWRGDHAVGAYCDVDPDRCERSDESPFAAVGEKIDTDIWQRQPIDALVELRKVAS